MIEGIYEALVTQLIQDSIHKLDRNKYHIKETAIDKDEAVGILAQHLSKAIKHALSTLKGDDTLLRQLDVANKIIHLLKAELKNYDFEEDLIAAEAKILKAVFSKTDAHFSDLDLHLKDITPYTRLNHSELFTGGNGGISLESELRKEILSSNRIDLLVSFIKWKGIRILEKELTEFTNRGGQLRVITTTYMGATDYKAIELLSKLQNTEVKVSYNTGNERLHAKAYLFHRNSGFHTGYIGSSNFSRSALTDGLEWNLKVTTTEVGHIIDKFQKTFDSYWRNAEFEVFDASKHAVKLTTALKQGKASKDYTNTLSYFDVTPHQYQSEILEKLEVERTIHNRYRNLLVAATGTGKTVISAFDYAKYKRTNKSAKLLFVAHRKEILTQARATFQGILKDNNFGELWVDGIEPNNFEFVFASVQTLNNRINNLNLSPKYYDFIVVDEVHHIKAQSYRPIINYFKPKILLGLTATPERMDGGDILEDFCDRIAAEIRLPEAMNQKILCPFQYFGVTDSVDLTNVKWEKGRYVAGELSDLYTSNDLRVNQIINNLNKYTTDLKDVRALGFCASIEHARYMTQKFNFSDLRAAALTSDNIKERESLREKLRNKEINYLFVVDIFNEGVDIPEIDTILFLRPTESLTVFLQQLGRGLRLSPGKDCLTVLDFVGNARPEYNFENKFRALIGKTTTTVEKEIKDSFPHLPLGCAIVLEQKAKETILSNIIAATSLNINQLIDKIRNFNHQTTLPLTLKNFIEFSNIPLYTIYKKGGWMRLCERANRIDNFDTINEDEIIAAISNKWLATKSTSYFNFILNLARNNFNIEIGKLSEEEKVMLLMLHYDVWQNNTDFTTLKSSIKAIGKNKVLVQEIIELLEILLDNIDFKEVDIELPYVQPLKLHARYTRDQILVAFGMSTFDKRSSNREGVAENKDLNTEVLFIDLIKSEEDFSPTTLYNDYAVSETIFHWQTQNSARPDKGKGYSYIHHKKQEKIILLFVRENKKDEFGNRLGYVFLGEGNLLDSNGSKPMNINWELNEPIPHYLWKESAKLAIGS